MSLTAGALSQISVSDTQAVLAAAAATGGTTPYSYQWYRSTTTGFTPGGGNILAGKTALSLTDTGLTPGVTYYYNVVSIDSAGTPATVTATQLAVTMLLPQVSQNQFTETPILGELDQRFNYNTLNVMFDPAGSGTLSPGQAVKWSTNASGVPMVVPSTATADKVAGFVNYNIKNAVFVPGNLLEISQRGNVIYLTAVAAINRGQEVTSLPSGIAGGCIGGVTPVTGSSGLPKVGFALDTVAVGSLVRIEMQCPANTLDS